MATIPDALEVFARGPAALKAAIADVTPAELDFQPAPGKWTIRQLVRHVADTEIVAGMRLRHIAAEDRPTLIPFDQDKWADNLSYSVADPNEALVTFRALRDDTARLLGRLPEAAFDRIGVHPERGDRTLLSFVELFGNHVIKHVEHIRAIREAFAKQAQ
ncbi:MAG: yfiT [Bryobacterales bacterium]|jgi:hypothetical protein|nr:yfiT [Bryobacterales bacterium]